jgi:hypothetical protein
MDNPNSSEIHLLRNELNRAKLAESSAMSAINKLESDNCSLKDRIATLENEKKLLKKPVRIWTGNFSAGAPIEKVIDCAEFMYEQWLESQPINPKSPHATNEMVGAMAQSMAENGSLAGSAEWYRIGLESALACADFTSEDIINSRKWKSIVELSTIDLNVNSINLATDYSKISVTITLSDEFKHDSKEDDCHKAFALKFLESHLLENSNVNMIDYRHPHDTLTSAKSAINTLRRMGYIFDGGRYWKRTPG